MNWATMTTQDFLTWLSQEGRDGVEIIQKERDRLPWSLKTAVWVLKHRKYLLNGKEYVRGVDLDYLNIILLNDGGGLSWLTTEDWLNSFYHPRPLKSSSEGIGQRLAEEEWAEKIILGDKEETDKLLAKYTVFKEAELTSGWDPRIEDERAKELSIEEWNKAWAADKNMHFRQIIMASPYVPFSCLDKWRKKPVKSWRENIIEAVMEFGTRPVPAHWMPEILADKNLLDKYLETELPEMEFRRQMRRSADQLTRDSAMSQGEWTEAELAALAPHEWTSLKNHKRASVAMATGVGQGKLVLCAGNACRDPGVFGGKRRGPCVAKEPGSTGARGLFKGQK